MQQVTIDVVRKDDNASITRMPVAPLLPQVAMTTSCTNNTANVATYVYIVEKFDTHERLWKCCIAKRDKEPLKYIKREDKRQPPSPDYKDLLHKLVLQFNTILDKNEDAHHLSKNASFSGTVEVKSVATFNTIGDNFEYISVLIVKLEPKSWIKGLRLSFNITPEEQETKIFRVRCFNLETQQLMANFVTTVSNGGTKQRAIKSCKNFLQSLGIWQETYNVEADQVVIAGKLNEFHSQQTYQDLSIFTNAFIVQHRVCIGKHKKGTDTKKSKKKQTDKAIGKTNKMKRQRNKYFKKSIGNIFPASFDDSLQKFISFTSYLPFSERYYANSMPMFASIISEQEPLSAVLHHLLDKQENLTISADHNTSATKADFESVVLLYKPL